MRGQLGEEMSVWFCIPSKRPPEEAEKCLKLWWEHGYKIALWLDAVPDYEPKCHKYLTGLYPGYPTAVNNLVKSILAIDPQAEWFVTGGDDIEPDANHSAEEIARECSAYFETPRNLPEGWKVWPPMWNWATFGVMQPTGDKWGDRNGPYIERVAGSPWMGREFCRRMYQGKGPLCEEYFHMGEDEELQCVATKLGVFWQRPDLIHFHRHWGREPNNQPGQTSNRPAFLERANSPEEWRKYKELFRIRQQLDFPGHEPLTL